MSKQSSPGGYLVKDFADGWYWTPNAALDHAGGAPVWSVADGRYETDPPALATREEAPAETTDCKRCAGNGEIVTDWERYLGPPEPGDQGDEGTADCPDCDGIGKVEAPAEVVALVDHLEAYRPHLADDRVSSIYVSMTLPQLDAVLSALRDQPQAREDAQPVWWAISGSWTGDFATQDQQVVRDARGDDTVNVTPLYIHSDHGALQEEIERLRAALNTPEVEDFAKAVVLEAQHQRERWPSEHDAGKAPLDWFWLIGFLAQKAATAQIAGDDYKAKHHTISTAAALANWHAAISGEHTAMRPGIEPPATEALAALQAEQKGGA